MEINRVWDDPLSKRPHVDILLDSSFVISLLKQRRDFERELSEAIPKKIKIKIVDLVILELERLARKSSSATRSWARASLEHLAKRDYQVVEHKTGPADVDASLMALALSAETSVAVATIDRELRDGLSSLGIPVITPRKGHGLTVEGNIA